MATIEGLRGAGGAAAPNRSGRRGACGWVAPGAADEAPAVPPGAPIGGLDGLLALQEREGDAVAERRARRHGKLLLAGLARLQLGVLAADGPSLDDLRTLASLCGELPFTADAGLRGVLQSIALRGRIELARRMTT